MRRAPELLDRWRGQDRTRAALAGATLIVIGGALALLLAFSSWLGFKAGWAVLIWAGSILTLSIWRAIKGIERPLETRDLGPSAKLDRWKRSDDRRNRMLFEGAIASAVLAPVALGIALLVPQIGSAPVLLAFTSILAVIGRRRRW